ncbi:TPA: receptor-recognizing protein [Enterobacter kobei]|uniref:receptor-recognizing protein n=1 Tax=Enterobacter cloacae complex TaxID=354276 RepID=UPI00300F1D8D|nr:receptor-recognizing protein [Enterobacter kobei]
MAIVGYPGWIGSSAVTETGQRWMTAARTAVFLTNPGFMSAMAGKSKEVNTALTIGANNAYTNATLINAANAIANRSITNLTITVTGTIVSNTTGAPCLNFPAAPFNEFKSVHLIINSGVMVLGRGGNGGSNAAGGAGGVAITNSIGTKLRISNNGTIGGGGGGGGGGYYDTKYNNIKYISPGGGGRPFGAAGTGKSGGSDATAGSISAPGAGGVYGSAFIGGAGGNLGAAGQAAQFSQGTKYAGGAAGAALNGSAPTWGTLGTINGSRL